MWWILLLLFYRHSFRKIKLTLTHSNHSSECSLLPENMTAVAVGVIKTGGFDHKYLAAETIHLAIMGYITIHKDNSSPNFNIMDWWRDDSYKLMRTNKSIETDENNPYSKYHSQLLHSIFLYSNIVKINHTPELFERYESLYKAFDVVWADTKKRVSNNFIFKIPLLLKGLGISIIALAPVFFVPMRISNLDFDLFLLLTVIFIITNYYITRHSKLYSAVGVDNLKKIINLEKYLSMKQEHTLTFAEQKIMYEKYLPYSIALGGHSEWLKRFDESFKKNYQPTWYTDSSKKFELVWFDFADSFSWSIYKNACRTRGAKSGRVIDRCKMYKIF